MPVILTTLTEFERWLADSLDALALQRPLLLRIVAKGEKEDGVLPTDWRVIEPPRDGGSKAASRSMQIWTLRGVACGGALPRTLDRRPEMTNRPQPYMRYS
jgi:hypothetical protein